MWIISYYFKFNYPLHLYIETGTGKRYVKDRGKKDKKERKFIALKNKDIESLISEVSDKWNELYHNFMKKNKDKLWKFRYHFPGLKKL